MTSVTRILCMAVQMQAIGLALWPYLYDKNQWCLSSVKEYVQGPGVSVQVSGTSVQGPRYLAAPCTRIFCKPLYFNHIDFYTVQGPHSFWGPCTFLPGPRTLWTWLRSNLPGSCFHIAKRSRFEKKMRSNESPGKEMVTFSAKTWPNVLWKGKQSDLKPS